MTYIIYDVGTGDIVGTAESPEPPEMPEGFAALPGDRVDPRLYRIIDGEPVLREVPLPAEQAPRRYSFNEWVDRFPFEAQVAIATATTQDPVAKLIYDRAMSAGASSSIDPADPRTAQGVMYLVSQGYITQAQAETALTL